MRSLKKISESGRDAALFTALLGLGCLLLARYLAAEHTYYYWDHALYPAWAFGMFAAFKADTAAAWAQMRASFNDDYSRIYTVPELAAFALFGANRLTYMLANFVVYGGGLALAVGAIAARLMGWRYGRAIWLALLALLCAPFVWIPLVDAYPDLGGTALLAAALALLLRRWPQVDWRVWVAVGGLLTLAILFRRHFIYPAAALLAAAGLVQFCWRVRREPLRRVVQAGLGVALATAVCAGLLYLAAPEFVMRLLILNYPQLYASYAEDVASLLDRQLLVVGNLTLCSALAGYALAWRSRPEIRASLALLLLLGLLWGIMWFGFVRFGGKHYLLQVLPIVLPVGWLLLGRELWAGSPPRRVSGSMLALVLLLQATLCFWFGDVFYSSAARQPLPGIFALARPPLVREDAARLRELVDYLHATSGGDDRIAVIASSPLFNQDLLGAVDRARAEESGVDMARLPIVVMPEIDRRDPLPLDAIAQATILLVVIPPQYHLKPEGQQVIGSVLALLTAMPEFAQAWKQDDRHFMLDHGVTVAVVRLRQPRTPATMAAMLRALRDRAASSGSLAQDWVLTRADFNGRLATDGQNRSTILGTVLPLPEAKPFVVFFMVPLPPHAYRVVGKFTATSPCALAATLHLLAGDGKELQQITVTPPADGAFIVDIPAVAATTYLQLSVQATAGKIAPCPFTIEGLQVLGQ
jgi:hypothetical protein